MSKTDIFFIPDTTNMGNALMIIDSIYKTELLNVNPTCSADNKEKDKEYYLMHVKKPTRYWCN